MPYLTCSLLDGFSHGFFTRQFWGRSPETLVTVLDSQAEVYRTQQVHGKRVVTPSEINLAIAQQPEEEWVQADGLMSERSRQSLWVASADCTPALIADLITKRVAAVHAGWRGTAQKIVPEAIQKMVAAGSNLKDLRVAMGPAIAGEVYQVAKPVAAQVGASLFPDRPTMTTEAILDALWQLPNPPLFADPEPEKVRLDVRRVNALQLEQLGLSPEQIAIAPLCTYQQPDYFFSYRRSKAKKVQWSTIISPT